MAASLKVFIFAFLCMHISYAAQHKVLVLDTAYKDILTYKRFFEIARQSNLDIEYKGLGDLIDSSVDDLQVEKYDALFFLIDDSVIASLQTSPLSQKITELIKKHSSVENSLTALFLPSFGTVGYRHISSGHPLTIYNEWLKSFGLSVHQQGNFQMNSIGQQHLSGFSGSGYKGKVEQLLQNPCKWIGGYATSLNPLARGSSAMHIQGDTLGFFIPLPRKKHKLFLGSLAMSSYASVQENFKLVPLDLDIQSKLDDDLYHGFKKIASAIEILKGKRASSERAQLDRSLLEGEAGQASSKEKKVLAWMDIDLFGDEALKEDQERLIDSLVRADFDGLWLSIAPNQYFSVRAKFFNRREKLGRSIQVFSEQLKKAYNKVQKELPQIFISFEIANNFVEKNKYPEKSMIDLFGNRFKDIPEPLDRNWWRDEIIVSAERFMPFWRIHAAGLDIAGFFIDLEMYMRNESKVGEFVSSAQGTAVHKLFSLKEATIAEGGNTVVQELMKTGRGNEYFNFLSKQSEELGLWIKSSLQKIVPNCRVACYAATISLDWFYQGFYKGLSSEQDPLWLCSFNSRFNWFSNACKQQGLYIEHFSVLMLSHMKTSEDSSLFNELLSRNDGIWLNKVSRMAHEYRSGEWHVLEQTPLSFPDRARFLDVVAKK